MRTLITLVVILFLLNVALRLPCFAPLAEALGGRCVTEI
jgi:hypothetical protein